MRALLASCLALCFAAPARADDKPPVITHVHIEEAKLGEPIRIRAKIDDESAIFEPSVYLRAKGGGEFRVIAMTAHGDAYEAIIPGDQVTGDLEYFIEAFDEQGNGPSREGSPEDPIAVHASKPRVIVPVVAADPPPPPPAKRESSILGAWWFWTAIGVVVAGGATATAIALTSGSSDFVDLRVSAAAPESGLP